VKPAILEVRDLTVHYHTDQGPVQAVSGVNFEIRANECLGLVGESGSGKSTIAMALLRMIRPPGRIERGSVLLDGVDLMRLPADDMRQMRLAGIALVAQGAMNSLNPVTRIRAQIKDALKDHDVQLSSRALNDRIHELLEAVGLRRDVADMYPHELSGGMKQRVCMAIAISLRPRLIIADEPTSALDVVVQRQVMDTLLTVSEDLGASILLIGHDMGLMSQVADRVGIMYAGKFVEVSRSSALFGEPLHPYSQLLINSLPSLETKGTLKGIPGLPPSLLDLPAGCAFRGRCPRAMDVCATVEPELRETQPDRRVSCHLY
jgi:peptide/nickel transport system ATP-binding protein